MASADAEAIRKQRQAAFPAVKGSQHELPELSRFNLSCWWPCGLQSALGSADSAMVQACCPYQGSMEANASLEKKEVVNSAHAYEGRMIISVKRTLH